MFKKIHVFRVKPGQELTAEIASFCAKNSISSGVIIGIIGSAEKAQISYLVKIPGEYQIVEYKGPLEIVCAQGSIALKGEERILHIHMLISNQEFCKGGHLVKATVFSTAEVTIGELDYQLNRYSDSFTGLNELVQN
jgi:predicted DNA-binding protein with PD1-like motif